MWTVTTIFEARLSVETRLACLGRYVSNGSDKWSILERLWPVRKEKRDAEHPKDGHDQCGSCCGGSSVARSEPRSGECGFGRWRRDRLRAHEAGRILCQGVGQWRNRTTLEPHLQLWNVGCEPAQPGVDEVRMRATGMQPQELYGSGDRDERGGDTGDRRNKQGNGSRQIRRAAH